MSEVATLAEEIYVRPMYTKYEGGYTEERENLNLSESVAYFQLIQQAL